MKTDLRGGASFTEGPREFQSLCYTCFGPGSEGGRRTSTQFPRARSRKPAGTRSSAERAGPGARQWRQRQRHVPRNDVVVADGPHARRRRATRPRTVTPRHAPTHRDAAPRTHARRRHVPTHRDATPRPHARRRRATHPRTMTPHHTPAHRDAAPRALTEAAAAVPVRVRALCDVPRQRSHATSHFSDASLQISRTWLRPVLRTWRGRPHRRTCSPARPWDTVRARLMTESKREKWGAQYLQNGLQTFLVQELKI